MEHWNLQEVSRLLLEAGKMAEEQRGRISRMLKPDHSLVTEADRNVEAFLRSRLAPEGEKALFLGEETADDFPVSSLNSGSSVWIVDPIDATANYAYGKTQWGISIGYAENGIICEGGVFVPREHALLISDHGKTFFADTEKGTTEFRELKKPDSTFTDGTHITFSQGAAKHIVFDGPNSFVSTGCCLTCGIDIALGRAGVYVTGAKIWDFSGFTASLRNLGCVSLNRSGTDLMSGKITEELYRFHDTEKRFAVQEINWLGVSREACKKTMNLCRYIS